MIVLLTCSRISPSCHVNGGCGFHFGGGPCVRTSVRGPCDGVKSESVNVNESVWSA